jgi:hypothetical protein
MASFTDKIPQFNPYIQQLPIEAMVQVGMQKQQRYDEGVQKIQTEIDNIAGLDVYKSGHKEYLQSKLNELGNSLKTVAAGDFSNFQLVNSVSGMTKQIIKDPIIQTAVSSTQRIRKEQENIQTAQKNGKSSIENEWWYNNQVNNWLNDNDLSKTFTGEFVEYTDVDKKLRDMAGKLKEIERSVDIPFQRDDRGNVLYFKTDKTTGKTTVSTDPNSGGEKKIDDAMLRVKVKGLPAQKILDNFYMSLDENDKRQLQITSAYHYRGATRDTFKADATSTINAQKKMLSDQIVDWSVMLKTNPDMSADQRAQIEAAIKVGNDKLTSGYFENELAKKIIDLDKIGNLDDYKYRLYTQKYLTGTAEAISNESRTEEILSNPYAQMDMEKKKFEFQRQRAMQEHQEFLMSHAVSVARLNIEREKWSAEKAEKEALQPIVERGGLGTNQKMPTLGELSTAITQTEDGVNSANSQFGNLLFPKLTGEARQKALNELVSKYATNPNSITDNNQRDYVETMRVLKNKLAQQNGLYAQAQAFSKDIDGQVSNLFTGYGGVNYSDGSQMYSAEELYRTRTLLNNFQIVPKVGGPGGKPIVQTDERGYINSLPAKLKPLGQVIVKWNKGEQLSSSERTIINRSQDLLRTFRPQADALVMEGLKKQSEYLAARMPEVQTTFGTLNMGDKVSKVRTENLIGNAIKRFDEFGALDVTNPGDFNGSTMSEWAKKGIENLQVVAEKRYDGSGQLVIYNEGAKQIIPLTADQLAAYYPNIAKNSFMTNVKYMTLSSPGKTTNSVAPEDPVNAYMSGYDIPGLRQSGYAPKVRLDVEAAPTNDGSDKDRFQVRMYVYNGSNWKNAILNQQGYVNAAGAEEIFNGIGPTTVKDVLNRR